MKHVLFVDDDANILDGLRRMLHGQRHVWDMTFAGSGKDALAAMAAAPCDVVVTDMQMPGMSGAEFLEQVQLRHPGTVRIVLSGHAELDVSLRSIAVSHQCLAKPSDAATLKGVVERACGLDELLRDPKLRDALGAVTELPVLPRVYQQLAVAVARPDVDLQQVGDILEQDAGLATKILQLVNSSYFGIRHEIADVRRATAFLGISTVRALVLLFATFRQFEGAAKVADIAIEREQDHALLTARIARRLLPDKHAADQAFLAAMVHDVGRLVLAMRLPEQFEKTRRHVAAATLPSHQIEEEVLGVSHAEIGAYLLGLWGMPYAVVEAVAHHHRPARVTGQAALGVLGAVHVAEALAAEIDASDLEKTGIDEPYLQSLGAGRQLPEWRAIAAQEAAGGRACPQS